jgi:DNA invertase Pin-like site-specific DNA recombinase
VMVIDEDLGRSAANAAERPGFARLVAEITMGHVGLALGLEMSRLARAGRDWHQLIELCSQSGPSAKLTSCIFGSRAVTRGHGACGAARRLPT